MRRHRSRYVEEEGFSDTAVFITPMLDMAFQVLTFFVFTYHPSALEGQFPITLASGEQGGPATPADPDKPASPNVTEVRPNTTVVARAHPGGQLASLEILSGGRRITIKPPEGKEVPIEELLAELEDRLWQIKKQNASEDRIVLQASPHLRWEESMLVMDSCRQTSLLFMVYRHTNAPPALPPEPQTAELYKRLDGLYRSHELFMKHFPAGKKAEKLFPAIMMDVLRPGQ
jgi:biopolymer transport protein ExbD